MQILLSPNKADGSVDGRIHLYKQLCLSVFLDLFLFLFLSLSVKTSFVALKVSTIHQRVDGVNGKLLYLHMIFLLHREKFYMPDAILSKLV